MATTSARAGPSTLKKRQKTAGRISNVQRSKHGKKMDEDKKLSELEAAVRDFVGNAPLGPCFRELSETLLGDL
jgi:hypothetical protein